ncbi:PRC-barrel domain-containing protein [Ancylobacter mangrovi]|uniref:PRC-barrel domain-containing protein n=1 Tax=Ancylobacter mangrovi TaxID=2972472 RepID=A0A9X2PB89_9HYPH|nr:PRC-barrel domain-containing protein [Ancylobacter mangrovi]MCS0495446.1 PRC-barrel domain-containing protein [Ancylobacter mangrovi]MCS0503094.1 PRC-barrel domain-containing protein [Ancylobacter mangrovi]
MTSKLATLTAITALSLAPAVAFAQSPSGTDTTTPPAATQTTPPASSPQAPAAEMPDSTMPNASGSTNAMPNSSADATKTVAPNTPKFVSTQSSGQWLGSDLIGTDVVTSNDEDLGSISDLVVERDGTIVAAVIDVGGFLGIGAKPVAVSFDSLTPTPTDNGQKIVVALTKEELNAAPEFKTLEQMQDESASKTN